MSRRHLTPAVLAGLLAAAPLAATLPGSPVAAQTGALPVATNATPLAECLADPSRDLAVLFAVDTSSSLNKTDKNGARVEGLRGAVQALGRVAEDRDVSVAVITIGSRSEVKRPFGAMRGSEADLLTLMDRFRTETGAEDTDYGDALVRATEVWASAPEGTCRLMVWFTDGKFDLDYQDTPKTIEWLYPPYRLDSADKEAEAMRRAQEQICIGGGVADRFRESIGTDAGEGAFVIGVTLGNREDFGFLREIVVNETGECGTNRAVGEVLGSDNVDDLAKNLIIVSDPYRQRAALGPFAISEAVETLRLRISWDEPTSSPVLRGPDGGQVGLGADQSVVLPSGAAIDVLTEAPSLSTVSISTPAATGTWDGDWQIVSADGSTPSGQMYLQEITGGLRAELAQDDLVIRRGLATDVAVQLISRAEPGEPRSVDAWHSDSAITIAWDGGATPDDLAVQVDGRALFEVLLPAEHRPDELPISATITTYAEVFADQPIELTAWEGDLGRLQVKDIPKSPIVGTVTSFGNELDQDTPSATAVIPVRTTGPESSGCLSLARLELSGSNHGEARVEIVEGDTTLSVGDGCAVRFAADTQGELELRITAAEDTLRTAGRLTGSFEFESISDFDAADTETFRQTFNVEVVPIIETVRPSTSTWVLWLALSLLVPLVLLYGYNALIAAKIDVVPGLYALVPVTVGPDRITRRGDSSPGSLAIGTLAEHEITPIFDTGLRTGPVDIGPVQLRARISAWPWGEPHGSATVDGAALAVSSHGTTPTGHAGRTELTTARTWVYWSDEAAEQPQAATAGPAADPDPDSADEASTIEAVERNGMLLVVLPPTPYGGDMHGLAPDLDDALADAHDTVSAVYATGTRPSRWTSLRRRFARPERPAAARPDEGPEPAADGELRTPDDDAFAGPSPF